MKTFLSSIILLSISAFSTLYGESTRVELFNNSATRLGDFFGNPLKPGTAADGDGASLQLGYYTLATLANPFDGTWVPLTGIGSNNAEITSIGDKGNLAAGLFNISTIFIPGSASYGNDLPTTLLPLSIRFYDSAHPAASTFFNAVSNTTGAWNWATPSEPQAVVTVSLLDSGLQWQGGSGSSFKTTINIVPEPTSAALLLAGACLLIRRRTLRSRNRNG